MSILWLVPAAFAGLIALAAPILVHLLTRQERRPIAFPSLRFLTATRLVALRRRRIHDWLLLAVRAATLAVAVAALAGPILITASRAQTWNTRVARAIVTVDGVQAPADEVSSAFASKVVPAEVKLAAALRSGTEWLAAQRPAARELLIVGDLREDAIDDADLAMVPAHVGIRFLPTSEGSTVSDVTVRALRRDADRVTVDERRVQLAPTETRVEPGRSGDAGPRIDVHAAADDQGAAEAALAALLAEGTLVDRPDVRHVVVLWPGATPMPEADGALIVRVPERPAGAAAVDALRTAMGRVLDDPALPREPRRIAPADLARWSRTPGPSPADAKPQDEGDRRVLWGVALALLAIEWLLRRERAQAGHAEAWPSNRRDDVETEGRVA